MGKKLLIILLLIVPLFNLTQKVNADINNYSKALPKKQMNVIDLSVTYWPQIAFLTLGVSFLIGEIYKSRLKIKETKNLYFYNNALKAIDEYKNSYFKYYTAMKELPRMDVFDGKISGKELDLLTTSYLRELQSRDLTIKLYLDKELYDKFNVVTKQSEDLGDTLFRIIAYDKSKSIDKGNEYDKSKSIDNDNEYDESKFINMDNKYDKALRKFQKDTDELIYVAFEASKKHMR